MNLQREILSRLTDSDLVELQNKLPTLQADGKLAKRLRNGEVETLMALVKIDEMTPLLRKALREYPMRWRVGVIYNYQTGQSINIQVTLGEDAKKRYQIDGQKIMFTWLDSKDHHLVLREVNNFVDQRNRKKIDNPEVLPLLLDQDIISVGFTQIDGVQSYELPLPKGEYFNYVPNTLFFKYYQPVYQTIYLNPMLENNLVFSGVPVQKSPEVEIYKSLLYR